MKNPIFIWKVSALFNSFPKRISEKEVVKQLWELPPPAVYANKATAEAGKALLLLLQPVLTTLRKLCINYLEKTVY